MSANEPDKLLEHDADGIQEYDNPLPSWWTLIFGLTIAFSVVYWIWYHGGGVGTHMHEDWANDVKAAEALNANRQPTEADLAAWTKDATKIEGAKAEFAARCAVCHLPDGGGLIGPNLTDKHWIIGKGDLMSIYTTIAEGGRPGKGMVPWKSMLSPAQMGALAAYIQTLQGTTPANPKAPEGEAVP